MPPLWAGPFLSLNVYSACEYCGIRKGTRCRGRRRRRRRGTTSRLCVLRGNVPIHYFSLLIFSLSNICTPGAVRRLVPAISSLVWHRILLQVTHTLFIQVHQHHGLQFHLGSSLYSIGLHYHGGITRSKGHFCN